MGESRDFLVPDYGDGPPLECMTCGRDEHDPDIEAMVYQNWNDDHGNRMYKCAACDEA